jgi:hypothetical protein
VVTGTVNGGDTINYTLATTASQFSNVGQYPIDVTLGANLTIVVSTNGILSVTQKSIAVTVIADENQKYTG